jgi:hypothetical protein
MSVWERENHWVIPIRGPTHPLSGVCEVAQRGLPALTPEWGHTIRTISRARNSVGELFLSCLDTEYYMHGWPLKVGVLLDARQPGRVLGDIPGAHPLPGDPNIVNFDAGHLTARRQGEAWLVAEAGADAQQRAQALRALRVSKLDLPCQSSRFSTISFARDHCSGGTTR